MNWEEFFHRGLAEEYQKTGVRPNRLYAGLKQRGMLQEKILHEHMRVYDHTIFPKLLSGERLSDECDCVYADVKIIWCMRNDWMKFYTEADTE